MFTTIEKFIDMWKQEMQWTHNVLAGLTDESRKIFGKSPDTAALLVADKGATLEMVTELVDAIKSGGIKKVAFSIQRKK